MSELTQVNQEVETEIVKFESWAKNLIIDNAESREFAINSARNVNTREKQILEFFEPQREATAKAHKAVVASIKYFTDRLSVIRKDIKNAVLSYDNEIERKCREEQVRLQAAADKKARIERERLEKQAAKLKTPELQKQRMEEAAEVIAPVVQVAEPEKVKGVSTRTIWKAKEIDHKLVPPEYTIFNQAAANAIARATKGNIEIPGIEFYEDKSLSIGA